MNIFVFGLLVSALFAVLCIRHFFIQLVSLKLMADTTILIITVFRHPADESHAHEALAWFLAALALIMLFVIFAAAVRRFRKASNLQVDGGFQ